jgi:hypothetical protein
MWFKRKIKNRRLGRVQVLDVKVRSSRVIAARTRLFSVALGVVFGTVFGLYLLWRTCEWALNQLVYENRSFAIQKVEIQTDGVISPEQIRRWSAIKANENLLALDLARVKRDLELVPMIRAVSVERILPSTVRIRVVEREPVAQINIPRSRPDGGIEMVVFQVDPEGYVMVPLDPRQRAVPLSETDDSLPVISGINLTEVQPGRKIDSPQMQAALRLIADFESSPMAGLVDLKRIALSSPGVLLATTAQGSEVTFGLAHFERQLLRWHRIHEECVRYNKSIVSLDLAVNENTPLQMQEASLAPPVPKAVKPPRTKKKNV